MGPLAGTGPGSFPALHTVPVAGPGEGLELVVLPSAKRRHGARLFRSLYARKRGRGPETLGLEVLRAPEIQIDSQHHVQLTLDAELLVVTPPVRIALKDC